MLVKMTNAKRYNGTCKACGGTTSVLATKGQQVKVDGHWTIEYVTETGAVLHGYSHDTSVILAHCKNGCPSTATAGGIRAIILKPVFGTFKKEITCGARCRGSKGHVCDCSCGGANHGMGC